MRPLRSILAATDLESTSDEVVRSAALLAARSGASLHLIHALEMPAPFGSGSDPYGREQRHVMEQGVQDAEDQLRRQFSRVVTEGPPPARLEVRATPAHQAITERAREVAADLIVVGPHRGGPVGAHFLGTTADRVIRTAEVPCLVVREALRPRVERIGVPIDFSDPSQGALETALAWGLALTPEGEPEAGPQVRVMHVGWPVEQVDNPDIEERLIRPALEEHVARAKAATPGADSLDVRVEVVWANKPSDATVRWAEDLGLDLMVMGTHGHSGLRRGLIGSVASSLARQTPCPVLLVPPSQWGGLPRLPRLGRVAVATDFSEQADEAARWSAQHFAPGAEHVLVHVLEVPEPPAALAGRYGPRSELLQTAREGARQRLGSLRERLPSSGAEAAVRAEVREGLPAEQIAGLSVEAGVDLVVVGERGQHRGAWSRLGTTAERVLRASPVPVLVARGSLEAAPRSLLVAVDGSDASLQALVWADFLRARFDADLTALYVESPSLYDFPTTLPADLYAPEPAPPDDPEADDRLLQAETWLGEEVRRAGVEPSSLTTRVVKGSPASEILNLREEIGADLVVIGSQGRGAIGRALLGSVAGAVLRGTPCPVLVVGPPAPTGA